MDEFNEKDHLDRDGAEYRPASPEPDSQPVGEPEASAASGSPVEPEAPDATAATEPEPVEAEEVGENRWRAHLKSEYHYGAPEEADRAPTEAPPPANETGYWSNRTGGQAPYQGAYQQPQRGGYPPPYYGQNNGYPPQNGYGYGRQSPYGQNHSYPPAHGGYQQYGTSSGWQQQPPPPHPQQPDNYDWKFEDYDNLAGAPRHERKARNKGVFVFTVALVCFLCVGLLGLSGYSVYMAYVGDTEEAIVESSADGAAEGDMDPDLPEGELEITARTDYTESLPVGGRMTIPDVAETVLPSVTGVFNYRNDQMLEPSELGSGIVMNTDGYIITNAHVVAGGTGFKVQIHDGEIYDAILVGADEMSDLAVLKIEAEGLVPAQFGDSEAIRVGETVVAIGNPAGLNLAGSVTRGVVSAVNRSVQSTNNMDYIQTDAAINPGNSGGALANEYGQVIGINSSKIVDQAYEGIGFAIPISEAKPIIDELISDGRVTSRAMLGIDGVAIDAVGAREYGERGILIGGFSGNEDLERNGAQLGDIITHVDGERIYTLADLREILDTKKAGDTVTLTLYRRLLNQETNFDVQTRLVGNDGPPIE